jgi:hypothetical protein
MKWPSRDRERQRLVAAMKEHAARIRPLPGVADENSIETLAMQFVASLRREDYYAAVQQKKLSADRADPNSAHFEAERAVAYHLQNGDVEEAGWLVFLMTHFARPADTGWLRLKDVYGKLGQGVWTWTKVSACLNHSERHAGPGENGAQLGKELLWNLEHGEFLDGLKPILKVSNLPIFRLYEIGFEFSTAKP